MRDAALRRVFGDAVRIEPRSAYLTAAELDSVRRWGRARCDAPRFTYYVASRNDTLLGRAYLDTHPVRSMPATILFAVDAAGRVSAVEILAFHEPEDYLPPRRWLDRLVGRTESARLRPGEDLDGISGATLSARSTAEALRRVLALDRLLRGAKP